MDALGIKWGGRTVAMGCVIALAWPALAARAGTLTATVTDRDGAPVREAAVYATREGHEAASSTAPRAAVMDQREQRFIPHLLVVEAGTPVEFPNHDAVRHHVYSFAPSNSFELSLYSGYAHDPIVFDVPGIVDVGCNIHDHMEAHIVVVDTPYFAVTSASGSVELSELPSGSYTLSVYSPRLPPKSQPTPIDITLGTTDIHIDVQLAERLRPPHGSTSDSLEWSGY